MRHVLPLLFGAVLVASPAFPQQPAEAPKEPAAVQKPAETGQAINVKIEVTITDQGDEPKPAVRVVTLLVTDSAVSRIRTASRSDRRGELNVDARPRVLPDRRIQLNITVEYRPGVTGPAEAAPSLSQSLAVILHDGKPLVVSQSADPNSDRTVKMEVKATVLR